MCQENREMYNVDCVVNFKRLFGVISAAVWFWTMFRVVDVNGDKVCRD